MGAAVLLSCWARIIANFLNNLCIGKPYLHVICRWCGKNETRVLLVDCFYSKMATSLRLEDRLEGEVGILFLGRLG